MMIRQTLPSAVSLLAERSPVPVVAITAHAMVLIVAITAHPRVHFFVLPGHPTAAIFLLPAHSTVPLMVSTLHHERRSLQVSCNKIPRWVLVKAHRIRTKARPGISTLLTHRNPNQNGLTRTCIKFLSKPLVFETKSMKVSCCWEFAHGTISSPSTVAISRHCRRGPTATWSTCPRCPRTRSFSCTT